MLLASFGNIERETVFQRKVGGRTGRFKRTWTRRLIDGGAGGVKNPPHVPWSSRMLGDLQMHALLMRIGLRTLIS